MINQQHLFPHRLFMMIINKNTNNCNLELVKYLQQINDFINETVFFFFFVKELQVFAASKKHVQPAICNCTVTVSNGKGLNHLQIRFAFLFPFKSVHTSSTDLLEAVFISKKEAGTWLHSLGFITYLKVFRDVRNSSDEKF